MYSLKITGSSNNTSILGFMMAAALLSLWISTIAMAMLMKPIALSVVRLIAQNINSVHELDVKNERNFAVALMLTIGYAASLRGVAAIIGTPPIAIMFSSG